MATPTYVAKKVGDEYVLVREDAETDLSRSLYTIGGGALALYGLLVRRGFVGNVVATLGASLIYRGVTGVSPLTALLGGTTAGSQPEAARSPQAPSDRVEEASMESFPASDPPACSGTDLNP